MAKDKVVSLEAAVEKICDGQSILVPGFVTSGLPETLIRGVIDKGCRDLHIISSTSSVKGRGIGMLIHENRVRHLTCSHIGSNTETKEKVVSGELNITFIPQGTLCECVRAGGAGIGGVLTPTGLGTEVAEGKQIINVDGRDYLLEKPIRADVALIHAWRADRMGNVVYRRTSRNFSQIFAMAADYVVVEAEEVVETGELDPDLIMTPGALVDAVVLIGEVGA